jgi:hypothetical protein
VAVRTVLLLGLLAVAVAAAPSSAATPRACGAESSRAAVRAFVGAFNRGDLERLDSVFAAWPDFQWYSSGAPGPRLRDASFTRDTLLAYFARRHRADDRLQLVRFRFTGVTGSTYGNFALTLRRSAADYRDGAWFDTIGKGAVSCRSAPGKVIVLSLGGPRSGR